MTTTTTTISNDSAKPAPVVAEQGRRPAPAKISHPRTSGIIHRERLFRILDHCRESPITWVAAPAGSGKTTLVASYLAARKLPSIWYRVDEGDGDIATFFYYMGLAANKAAPRKHSTLPLFTPEYLKGFTTFTLRYFERLFSLLRTPYVIVLDNYQHAQGSAPFNEVINAGMEILPDGLNMIIISREQPPPRCARLRVNGRLALLQGESLLFHLDESAKLLHAKGVPDTDGATISLIHGMTRGWAAGLVLMAEESRGEGGADHVHACTTPQEIFDYFATEIFDRADQEKQDFLLRTSLLPWVTARTAERITGCARAGEILSTLHRNQFFTERDTASEPIYRYHPLFREFLLSRARGALSREETVTIQRNAATLFMEAGKPEEAAGFFLDAGDWAGFVTFLLNHAPVLIAQGRIKTLEVWLAQVPMEMIANTPWLLYWLAVCRMGVNPARARGDFEQAFRVFEAQKDDAGALLAWSGIIESAFCEFDDFRQFDRWIDWLEERTRRDPSFPSMKIEAAVSSSMAGALIWRCPPHPDIRSWLNRALSSARESGDIAGC